MSKIGTVGNRNPYVETEGTEPVTQNEEMVWQNISERISQQVARIYYPCCGVDRTVDRFFPNRHIIYLDINASSFDNDGTFGTKVIRDVHEFVCDTQVDLGLLRNPDNFPRKFLESIRQGGYVVSNNFHGTARNLYFEKDVTLIGWESIAYGWVSQPGTTEYLEKKSLKKIQAYAEDLFLFQKN